MASSALAFVEGLQGGMSHRADSKRKKKIDRLLDVRGQQEEMDLWAQKDDAVNSALEEGWDLDLSSFETDQDPYDMDIKGFFGRLGNAVGIKNDWDKEAIPSPVKTRLPGWSGMEENDKGGVNTYGMPEEEQLGQGSYYADGGPVRYADGGPITAEEIARRAAERRAAAGTQGTPTGRTTGNTARYNPARVGQVGNAPLSRVHGGLRNATGGKLARNLKGAGKFAARGALPVVAGLSALESGETGTDEYIRRYEGIIDDSSDDSALTTTAKDVGRRTLGVAEDLGNSLLAPLEWMGLREGSSRYDGMEEEPPTAAAQAIQAAEIAPPPPKDVAAQRAQPDQTRTTAAPAPAQSQPEEAIPAAGGPNGDIDWSKQPVVDPGSMPTHTTQDWVAYRASSVTNMIMRGASPDEAHQRVTEMQQRGFLNHGQQALMLLAAGDGPRATMALKAAYQYFPNGVDVKFGITQGKSGQPALIAMGQLEGGNGESTGKPMLLTTESLAAMLNNMTDPSAFTGWTKDWRDEQFSRQQHRDNLAIDTANAESSRINARANERRSHASMEAALRAGTSGMKRTDVDRNIFKFMEVTNDAGLMEDMNGEEITPDQQRYLASAMAQMFYATEADAATIVDQVMSATADGTLPELLAQYGIESAEAGE